MAPRLFLLPLRLLLFARSFLLPFVLLRPLPFARSLLLLSALLLLLLRLLLRPLVVLDCDGHLPRHRRSRCASLTRRLSGAATAFNPAARPALSSPAHAHAGGERSRLRPARC